MYRHSFSVFFRLKNLFRRRVWRGPGFVLSIFLASIIFSCRTDLPSGLIVPPTYAGPLRSFESSFESVSDFSGFYIVPPESYGSSHELSTEQVKDGTYAHKAWIVGANAADNDGVLISHARVEGGAGGLAQAHFGLYAAAAVPAGTIYNDRLRIKEVADEAEALALVAAPW